MTTQTMQIRLSQQAADARWGENATISYADQGMTIHLTGDALPVIQRAAHKIDGQGIRAVELTGDGWDLERCWAFWQGFRSPKGQRDVHWPALSDAEKLNCNIA